MLLADLRGFLHVVVCSWLIPFGRRRGGWIRRPAAPAAVVDDSHGCGRGGRIQFLAASADVAKVPMVPLHSFSLWSCAWEEV